MTTTKTLTAEYKRAVYALIRAGISDKLIVKMTGVKPGSLAAYKAWVTMKG